MPAPLGPSRPWAPLPSSTVTSLTPITDPKTFVTCVRESMGSSARMIGKDDVTEIGDRAVNDSDSNDSHSGGRIDSVEQHEHGDDRHDRQRYK